MASGHGQMKGLKPLDTDGDKDHKVMRFKILTGIN